MRSLLAVALLTLSARAQEGALDVLDGETLYEGGWLLSVSAESEERSELLDGSHSIADPLGQRLRLGDRVLSVHYGLRNDLQLSLAVPQVARALELEAPSTHLSADGLGDVVALAKWRFHRWDAPHKALNVSLLAGLELPTGEDDARDGGVILPEVLQPGSGSVDPLLGVGATYEPGRWRFNAVALWKHNGSGGEYAAGDELLLELAAGNRFWLEPYPGPFMRADVLLRHRRQERFTTSAAQAGAAGGPFAPLYGEEGGDLTTWGLNWAFRPRPSLDFQLAAEFPIDEHVEGSSLGEEATLTFSFGYRF